MNKGVLWKGRQDKDFKSISVFIKALTKPGFVALDAYVSTNDCNHCLLIISILKNVLRFFWGTLLMDGFHYGFQGVLMMFLIVAIVTLSKLKATLLYLK